MQTGDVESTIRGAVTMTFNRTIEVGYYIRFPKGMYTDVKKISTALYSPARDSNEWLERIANYNKFQDVYVENTRGAYYFGYIKPSTHKEMFQYTLGGL